MRYQTWTYYLGVSSRLSNRILLSVQSHHEEVPFVTLAQYSRGPRYAPETLDLPTYHRVLAQRHNLHSSIFAPLRASCPYIMSKVDVYPFCVLQHTHFRLQPKGLALDFFNVGACHGAASSFTSLALVQMMTRLKIKVSCLCHTPHYVISYHRASAIVPFFLSG